MWAGSSLGMVLFSSSRYSVSPLNLLISTVVAVHSLSHGLFVTPWTAASQDSPSFIISWSLLRFMSVELAMPSSRLLCHPFSSCSPCCRVFRRRPSCRSRLLLRGVQLSTFTAFLLFSWFITSAGFSIYGSFSFLFLSHSLWDFSSLTRD